MKKAITLTLALILTFTLAACGGGSGGGKPSGTYSSVGGDEYVFTGNNFDHTMSGVPLGGGTFKISGDKLTLTIQGATVSATYDKDRDVINISGAEYTKGGGGSTSNGQKPADNSMTNASQDNSSATPPLSATESDGPVVIYENDEFKLTAVEIGKEKVNTYFGDEVNKNFTVAALDMINEAPIYNGYRDISKGCAYIDSTGNVAFTLMGYKAALTFSEGLVAVLKYDEWAGADVWGFVDTTGNEVIKCEYERAANFSEGLAAVKKSGKWGYIDTKGNVVIPFEYEQDSVPTSFHEGRAWVPVSSNTWNLIDTSGNQIGESANKLGDFCDGVAPVLVENKLHFVDTSGNDIGIVADFARDGNLIHGFSEGLAAVYSNDAKVWGFIDKTGAFVIEPEYEKVTDFKNGLAGISKNGKWGVINNTGEMIIPCKLDSLVDPATGAVYGLDIGLFVSNKTDMTGGAHGMIVEMITAKGESFTVEVPGFKEMYTPSGFINNFAVWTDLYNSFNIRYLIIEKITK